MGGHALCRITLGGARAALLLLCCAAYTTESAESGGYGAERERMVRDDIAQPRGGRAPVRDARVLDAMRAVPRHRFVPEAMRSLAHRDGPLAIGHGQTISQPYIVAAMTELLGAGEDDVVLEIGTGSGYQAAVLAECVKQVYTIEIVAPLGEAAKKLLAELGYKNVEVKIGDGYAGWPEHAPFDGIIVTAAPETIPPALIEQLKPGGRMVIPVGPRNALQFLKVVEKMEDGTLRETEVMAVRFVPFTRAEEEK